MIFNSLESWRYFLLLRAFICHMSWFFAYITFSFCLKFLSYTEARIFGFLLPSIREVSKGSTRDSFCINYFSCISFPCRVYLVIWFFKFDGFSSWSLLIFIRGKFVWGWFRDVSYDSCIYHFLIIWHVIMNLCYDSQF